MKALTLTQPWATLVAVGAKQIETRSWQTWHRGPLAIHAAKGVGSIGGKRGLVALCEQEPFKAALAPHLSGYTPEERAADLPRGGVVAVVTLEHCLRIAADGYPESAILTEQGVDMERAFGNYAPGRYAWSFGRCLNVHDPIECSGSLGLWDLPEPVRRELVLITDMAWTSEEEERYKALADADDDRRDAIRQAIKETHDG